MSDEQQTSNTVKIAARWLEFEEVFSQARYEGGSPPWPSSIADSVTDQTPGLLEIAGSTRPRVVVTAPHATNHERHGTTKVADRGTGGLALLLAQMLGCTALVALDVPGDANYDKDHLFKDRLAALNPGVVIDLHGMRSRPQSDVDLGTGTGLAPRPVVVALDASDLRVTKNAVFDAMRPTTVTSFAQARGIPAIQLEIGAHLRPPSGAPADLARLVTALTVALERLAPATGRGLDAVPLPVASALPIAVLHPDALSGSTGPLPVLVTADGRTNVAWAWSGSAVGVPEAARNLAPGQVGVNRRLRAAMGGVPSVAVKVPPVTMLRTSSAYVDDMPDTDEVQINRHDLNPGTYLLVQRGTTAWVNAVARDHVRPGTLRIAYQLRLLTASDGVPDDNSVALVAAAPEVVRTASQISMIRRMGTAVDHTMELLWRALFRAPEFSARVMQAHPSDDGSPVISLHPAVYDRIGVEPGQQVLVRWGGREVVALAVADHEPPEAGAPAEAIKRAQRVNRLFPDLPSGLPPHVVVRMSAQLRHELGAPVATVITVRRRLRPVLVRNLNSLVVPLASLVLAGAALPDPHWPTLGLGTALMSVFALARLRIPQPRSRARMDEAWVEQMPSTVEAPGTDVGRGGEKVGG